MACTTTDMSDREVINIVKDLIQTNLEDPMVQWTGKTRNWCHTDEPMVTATYPRIQVVKRGPTNNFIESMGFEFLERREVIIDIYFWTKVEFKWKNENDVYLKNEQLVSEYLDKIWKEGIKPQGESIRDDYGIVGLKNLGEDMPIVEPDTELYRGIVSVRLWYWTR